MLFETNFRFQSSAIDFWRNMHKFHNGHKKSVKYSAISISYILYRIKNVTNCIADIQEIASKLPGVRGSVGKLSDL